MKPLCIMLVGLPGSGKSTFRTKLTDRFPGLFEIASVDDYIEQWAIRDNITFTEALNKYQMTCVRETKDDINLYVWSLKNFIWDQVNVSDRSKKLRSTMNEDRSEYLYTNVAIVCETPPQKEWLARIASRPGKEINYSTLINFENKFTYPIRSEGFDKIFKASEVQKIFRYLQDYIDKQNESLLDKVQEKFNE